MIIADSIYKGSCRLLFVEQQHKPSCNGYGCYGIGYLQPINRMQTPVQENVGQDSPSGVFISQVWPTSDL